MFGVISKIRKSQTKSVFFLDFFQNNNAQICSLRQCDPLTGSVMQQLPYVTVVVFSSVVVAGLTCCNGCIQGCQTKISIKSQTMLKRGQKRPNRLFKGQKKARLYLRCCYSFITKKHLNLRNQKNFIRNYDWILHGIVLEHWSSMTFHGLWSAHFG